MPGVDPFRIVGLSEVAKLPCYQMTSRLAELTKHGTLRATLQEDATRTLRFLTNEINTSYLKKKIERKSRKRILVVMGSTNTIAKGNVLATERSRHHGDRTKKESQGQS